MSLHAEMSAACREYARLTVRLHELMGAGLGESEEADSVRDQMDGPWKQLTAAERDRLGGLSSDLYMLSDEEVFERAEPAERGPDTLGAALLAARANGDWEAVLALLRKGPTFLSQREVAFFRAEAYDELGQPEIARRFARHAARLSAEEVSRKLVHT
jgi:hypothetical protein